VRDDGLITPQEVLESLSGAVVHPASIGEQPPLRAVIPSERASRAPLGLR
jgi:hypothetical protein